MIKRRRKSRTFCFSLRDKLNDRKLDKEDDLYWDDPEVKQEEDTPLVEKFPFSNLIYMHKYMWEKVTGIIIFLFLIYLLNFFNYPLAGNLKETIYGITVQNIQFDNLQVHPVFKELRDFYPFTLTTHEEENSSKEPEPEFIFPVEGAIAGKYGLRKDPFTGVTQMYYGIDLAAAPGAPVAAVASGQVVKIYEKPVCGLTVEIEHAGGISSIYAMLGEITVKENNLVEKGQIIGCAAEEENPLIHFQIRKEGHPVDPQNYFSRLN